MGIKIVKKRKEVVAKRLLSTLYGYVYDPLKTKVERIDYDDRYGQNKRGY